MKNTPLRAFAFGLAGATALLSVGCDNPENKAAWWQGEQQRIELSQNLALKTLRIEKATNNGLAEFERMRAAAADTNAKLIALRDQSASLREEVANLENDLPAFRETVLRDLRLKAVGEKFAAIQTPTGKSYKDVSVVSVSDIGVAIRHADGSARLAFDDLSAEQRAHFGIDTERAMAARKQEERAVANYERWLDTRLASMAAEKRQDTVLASAKASEARAERALASARVLASSANRSLAQPSRGFGRSSSYYSYRPYRRYYSGGYYNYRTYYSAPCYSVRNYTTDRRIQRYDRYNYAPESKKKSSIDNALTN